MTDVAGHREHMQDNPSQEGPPTVPAPEKFWARKSVIAVAALLLAGAGYGIGDAGGISAQHQLRTVRGHLSTAHSELRNTLHQLRLAKDTATSERAKVRAAQTAAAQANAKAQAKYKTAEARLTVATRAYDVLVGRIQSSRISGDGVYVVGSDIKAGTWHTSGDNGQGALACYYATLSDTNTTDIIDNNNFGGPETVNLSGAHAFQISGPCTWARTGP